MTVIQTFDSRKGPIAQPRRIGIISDTHGLLRPEAVQRLAGVDHILHAGDIGKPGVIEALRKIAPVTAVRGNVDKGAWADKYPETDIVQIAGRTIYLIHDVKELKVDLVAIGIGVVVYGHSHQPKIETIDGVLHLNPGSVGGRRFKSPVTLATLEIWSGPLNPVIHDLMSGPQPSENEP